MLSQPPLMRGSGDRSQPMHLGASIARFEEASIARRSFFAYHAGQAIKLLTSAMLSACVQAYIVYTLNCYTSMYGIGQKGKFPLARFAYYYSRSRTDLRTLIPSFVRTYSYTRWCLP